jgi:GNAT superfamily N-acetyltransferase
MNIAYKPAKVWYLELTDPKADETEKPELEAVRQQNIDPEDYLEKYRKIGGKWNWAERLLMERERLLSLLSDAKNEIYYCYFEKQFAGYFELDCHNKDAIELVYFGLAPEFIGKGLGRKMMQRVFSAAGRHQAPKLWLHTCSFDAPQALDFYLKNGFRIYKETVEDQPIISR